MSLCGVESAPIFFSLGKENGRGRSKEKRLGRGLWDVKSHRPAKAGVGFAEGVIGVGSLYRAARVWWMLWAAATIGPPKIKRLSATPCCRSVAVEGASVSEEAPCLRRAAMGAVLGVRAADRTLRPPRPPTERPRAKRSRVLASSISLAAAQAPPLTHSAARPFPTRTAALTFAREPCATWGAPHQNPNKKTFLLDRQQPVFFEKENGGLKIPRRFRGGKSVPPGWRIPAANCRTSPAPTGRKNPLRHGMAKCPRR